MVTTKEDESCILTFLSTVALLVTMVHRAQDTRLLIALVKAEKEYSACLNGLLNASQASFAALTAYGASCPPGQAQAVISVTGALSGAEDAFRKYAGVVEGWRGDLKQVKKSEDEVASILRDREIFIGRVVKASSKRTSRDSVLGVPFPPPPSSSSSMLQQDPNSSVATLGSAPAAAGIGVGSGSGSVKLSHAQTELQACEAHLALKEQELERARVRAVIGGLQRRCKALVECGWIWGEKGKEALRTLETCTHNANEDKRTPNGLAKHRHRHRHRRTTKSPVVSDHGSQLSSVTPSQSASQILPGSDGSADPSNRPVFDELRKSFSIDIPAAHSIDDHGAVHNNIPSSRLIVQSVKQSAESSDSDDGGKREIHKNKPFARPQSTPRMPETKHTLSRNTSNATTIKSASTFRPSSAPQPNVRLHKPKPVSDIGAGPTLVAFKPGEAVGMPYTRTVTTSGSLLGTITGLFKGRRASMDHSAVYNGPTAVSFANGWQTRTGRNLARARTQLSSSEEDLPSSAKKNSRTHGGTEEPTPKRSSTMSSGTPGPSRPSRGERSPDKGKARALPATDYGPQPTLERSSGSTRSRETAANTALNARTNGNGSGFFHDAEQHTSVGRSDSKRSATSSGNVGGRRRDPQLLNMVEVTRQSGGSRSNGTGIGGGGLVLPPARLEVVRAPPSVTQAPVLLGPSPSPLVLPSARRAPSGTGSRGAPSPPPNHGTATASRTLSPAPTSPRGGAFYATTANGDPPRPLKSALRNSNLSPSPSPAPAIHGSVDSSTPSPAGTPKMPTSTRLPDIHSPIPRPPPSTSLSGILPRPNRLSDIPASNRTSIASENEYETCVEDFVDAEEDTESDTPPVARSPPPPRLPASGTAPEADHRQSLPAERVLANGSPPADASVSSTSTLRGKSVRMIIHPTVTVSAPEEDTEPPTPPGHDRGKESEWFKLTGSRQSHSRSTSGSGTSHRSEVSRSAVPSAWETRVEHQRNVWDDSEPEDEGYRAAKSALQRASAL